jgi:cyclopropane-fatty-acyl-phospholipid synthase
MTATVLPSRLDYGGSAQAVQSHYDVGRDFYALWLGPDLVYSCALWDERQPGDTLNAAQQRKIDHHLNVARADRAEAVLDVGCGWGALLATVSRRRVAERIVGLTLSIDQADYVRSLDLPRVEVRLESWTAHAAPAGYYDSIVSIGAFEHFSRPEESRGERIGVYRDFFARCLRWLTPGGRMSLQTIAYGSMAREEASAFIQNEIFPVSELPRLDEIAAAADGVLEITHVHNHRLHYARTFEHWARNLRRRHREALALVGEEVTERYERFLCQNAAGFYLGKIALLRLGLRPAHGARADVSAP